jgi:hypothetical protein
MTPHYTRRGRVTVRAWKDLAGRRPSSTEFVRRKHDQCPSFLFEEISL